MINTHLSWCKGAHNLAGETDEASREQRGKYFIRKMTNCFQSTGKETTDLAEVDLRTWGTFDWTCKYSYQVILNLPFPYLHSATGLQYLPPSFPTGSFLDNFSHSYSTNIPPPIKINKFKLKKIFLLEEPSNILQLPPCWDWQLILLIQCLLVNTPVWDSGKSVSLPFKDWIFLLTW